MSRRRRSPLRWVWRAILVAGICYLGIFAWIWRASRVDQRRAAGAIVVLGAAHYNGRPSPVLQARIDHAYTLFGEGLAPSIVVTGGTHPGDSESEARVQRRSLVAAGIPETVIVELPQGQSTEASIRALGDWADQARISSVLLVSDGFHLGRLRLEAYRVGLTAYTSPVRQSPIVPGSVREIRYLLLETLKIPYIWLRTIL